MHVESVDWESLRKAARSFEPGAGLQARPLSMASFGMNHALHDLQPAGYKLTGILIHAINAVLILLLANGLIAKTSRGKPLWAAMAVATAWSMHPMQVSTVLYVVQRMESLSLLFVLAALGCYLQARSRQQKGTPAWPWLVPILPLVALGIAAKESAVLFFAYALAIELTTFRFTSKSERTARAWKWAYGLAIGVVVVGFAVLVLPKYWVPTDLSRGFGTSERLLSQLRILPMYLGQMLWPLSSNLPFNYDHLAPSRGWLEPVTTFAGGALLALLACTAIAARRRMPLYSLGIALFFTAHAITSNVIPLELAFEHRNYFALFGVLLAITEVIRHLPLQRRRIYVRAAVATMIALCAFLGHIRASIWGDTLLLATEHVSVNPTSARASADLAAEYLEMTDGYPASPFNDFAMREFERGSLLPGASIVSDQGLILTAIGAGRPVEPEWWDRLVHKIEHDRITPETTQALFGLLKNRLAGVAIDDDRLTEAFVAMFNRVSLPPYSYAQFGNYVIRHTGDQALADQLFVRAVEASVDSPGYAGQMITQLRKEGHQQQANAVLRRAQELGLSADIAVEPPVPGRGPSKPNDQAFQ